MADSIEKILNTKILLKYDTYDNWVTYNPVLMAGEVAIATIATGDTQEVNSVTAPQILIKVGDGTSDYKTLKFASGLAADVHTWAKADKKPTYAATEITGIGDYIAQYVDETLGISVDTDTQYRITKVDDYNYKLQSKAKGEADTAFVDAGTIVIPKYDDAQIKADIDALEELVGTTAVATQIANAIAALGLANTYEAKGTAANEAGKVQTNLTNYQVANDSVIDAIKDGEEIDSFKDVEEALAEKQDVIPENTYDSYGSAAQALEAAKKYADDHDDDTQYGIEYDSVNKKIKLVSDTSKTEIDATDFIKDGMIDTVALSEDGLNLVITWNTDAGKDEVSIPLVGLVDVYTGVDGTTVTVSVSSDDKISAELKTGSIKDGHIAPDAAIAKSKLAKEVRDSLDLANSALQEHQDISELAPYEYVNNRLGLPDLNAEEYASVTEYIDYQIVTGASETSAEDGVAFDLPSLSKVAVENYLARHDHSNKAVLDGITSAKVSAWDNARSGAKSDINAAIDEATGSEIGNIGDLASKVYGFDQTIADIEGALADKVNGHDLAAIAHTGNVNDLVQTSGDVLIFNCGNAQVGTANEYTNLT